jgi:hypothetical protein
MIGNLKKSERFVVQGSKNWFYKWGELTYFIVIQVIFNIDLNFINDGDYHVYVCF